MSRKQNIDAVPFQKKKEEEEKKKKEEEEKEKKKRKIHNSENKIKDISPSI